MHSALAKQRQVDIVISPATEICLGAFPLVNGFGETLKLLKLLKPKVLMPLLNGAIDQEGAIAAYVTSTGTLDTLRANLDESDVNVAVCQPPAIGGQQVIEVA